MRRFWFVLLIALFLAFQVAGFGCATQRTEEKQPAAETTETEEAPADEQPASE